MFSLQSPIEKIPFTLSQEYRALFTLEQKNKLLQARIIQKNLVHIQNVPQSLLSKLSDYECWGQYGEIVKIMISNSSKNKKPISAYVTFKRKEDSARAILSVDSFICDRHLIRAFYGTSKYCVHFWNNQECFTSDKCMYLHSLASNEDILGKSSKFGYNDHWEIAMRISNILDPSVKQKTLLLEFPKTILPNITQIYKKDIIMSAEKKLWSLEHPTPTPTPNPQPEAHSPSSKSASLSRMTKSWKENIDSNQDIRRNNQGNFEYNITKNDGNANMGIYSNKPSGDILYFKHKDKSRFFNLNSNLDRGQEIPNTILSLIDEICSRWYVFNNKYSNVYTSDLQFDCFVNQIESNLSLNN